MENIIKVEENDVLYVIDGNNSNNQIRFKGDIVSITSDNWITSKSGIAK
jgi:hypothetical protein